MLDKEFKYYLENQKAFVRKYNGKHLVIKGRGIIGVYDTTENAYTTTVKDHKPGTFLIQLCSPGKENYTQVFNSRATF